MTKCVENLDALFEEAWNRIPYCYDRQCSDDFQSSLCDDQWTLYAKDVKKELTEQNVQAEGEAPSQGKTATEADNGNHLQTTRQGSSDTTIPSFSHTTEKLPFPDSRTDETSVEVLCTKVQDLGEIKEEFDVYEVKTESEDDLNDFRAEQHQVLDATVNMSKSVIQPHTTNNDAVTTSRARSVRANKNSDVNGGQPRTPTEVCEEKESAVQGHGNIDSVVTVPSHLNDDHGSIHFYRGLKELQSRGMYTDICKDEVRGKVERVIIDRRTHYRCKVCFKTFYGLDSTVKHARTHAKGSCFYCGQCGRKFRRRFNYDIHLELHAQGQWKEVAGPGSRQYACSMCHKFFSTNALLTSHKMTHTEKSPYQCGVCDKGFPKAKNRILHENTHQRVKKKLACPICGRELSSLTSLARHVKRHKYFKAKIDAYQCDKCPETFTSGIKLSDHKAECHPVHPFSQICEKCGRSFSRLSTLQQHQRACLAASGRRKTFPCKVCGKEFGKSTLLCRHKMIHSSTRPFKCRHCDMTFRQSDARHRHEILHFKNGKFRDVIRHTRKASHGKDGRQFR